MPKQPLTSGFASTWAGQTIFSSGSLTIIGYWCDRLADEISFGFCNSFTKLHPGMGGHSNKYPSCAKPRPLYAIFLSSMQKVTVELVGLYQVEKHPDKTLVELLIGQKANEIDLVQFTQEMKKTPRENWQAPFGEKYLDIEGKEVIGDDIDMPTVLTDTTRLTFFIYFLDLQKPLLTPYGELQLVEKTEPPQRIKDIIAFEDPE